MLANFKQKPVRDWQHLEFIKKLSCCVCGCFPCDPAHIRVGTNGGMGQKPSDSFTVPLCRPCHDKQHRNGERTFWNNNVERPIELANALWVMTGDIDRGNERVSQFRRSKCSSS